MNFFLLTPKSFIAQGQENVVKEKQHTYIFKPSCITETVFYFIKLEFKWTTFTPVNDLKTIERLRDLTISALLDNVH